MTYNIIIPGISSLRIGSLGVEKSNYPNFNAPKDLLSTHMSAEEIPLPDEGEIYPNKDVPGEEEYFPNEKEVVIEEPPKEMEDPYFPRKGDDLPPEGQEEFPQTDPM